MHVSLTLIFSDLLKFQDISFEVLLPEAPLTIQRQHNMARERRPRTLIVLGPQGAGKKMTAGSVLFKVSTPPPPLLACKLHKDCKNMGLNNMSHLEYKY